VYPFGYIHSVEELTVMSKRDPASVERVLSLCCLVPNIQSAILKGLHPENLTFDSFMDGPAPLDLEHQRRVFGF